MKRKRNHNKLLIILGIIAGIVVLFSLPTDFISGDQTFTIPSQTASLNPNADVDCRYRNTVYTVDSEGKTIRANQGGSQFGNPVFSVVDISSGKSVAGVVVFPKSGCDAPASFSIGSSNVWATFEYLDSNNNWKTITSKRIQTEQVDFPANSKGVKTLGYASISADDIEDSVGTGKTSKVRVSTVGILETFYTDFSAIKYYYQIDKSKTFVETNSFETLDPSNAPDNDTGDNDNDGIINKFDQCLTQKEVYNGYKDGDGCPDSVPTNTETDDDTGDDTPPDTPDVPEDPPTNPIDSITECKNAFGNDYTWNGESCIPEDADNTGSPISKTAHILVTPKYRDGTIQAFTIPLENQSPIDVNFASLIGSFDGSVKVGLSEIEFEVFVNTGTSNFKVDSHSVTMKPTIRVAGTDIVLGEQLLVGFSSTNAKTISLPKTVAGGQTSFTGLSLGQTTLRAGDIETAISNDLVPAGQRRDIDTNIVFSGLITFDVSGAKTNANLENANVDWRLEIQRVSSQTQGNCPNGEQQFAVEGDVVCVPVGGTPSDNPPPMIGQAGVEICEDSVKVGGFPCTEDYRNEYCNGGTICEVPDDIVPIGCIVGQTCIDTPVDCPDDSLFSFDLLDECQPSSVGGSGGNVGDSSLFGALDNTTLILIGGAFALIGILVYIAKRMG